MEEAESKQIEVDREFVKKKCLEVLAQHGFRPDDHNIIVIKSGSIGIRLLGCVDFLASNGYAIYWGK